MNNLESDASMQGIAIIGLSGRFPGANSIEEFWQNLQAGIESISEFTEEELMNSGIDSRWLENSHYVKRSGILDNIEDFDAGFFDFTPKEAELTDPQHRLFLECAWEALESAGYDANQCDSRIGVYGGSSLNNYLPFNVQQDAVGTAQSYQKLIGNDKDFLTTRVSYKLNLTGPSLTVQTACSTSLVAVNLACQSLINYQCDMALAGGVSIRVPQKTGYLYQPGGPLSPDGHCRAFDANAEGTTVGNGVGVVLLKRLEEAIADGDRIYAVIKGWATNNDGSLKVGYTAPSVDGQAEAIAEAMLLAGVEAETIRYIEAHGTGTTLGDPIEIAALTQAFRTSTDKTGFCAIGSVKTNIGHLDAAAGVTGLIKTVLALKHQQIPPSLNFETPNPEIDFANSPFYVNTQLTAWQQHTFPRRAGVSALGMGGTNAHVILEEAPNPAPSSLSRPWQLVVISAKTQSALESATQNLAQHLTQHPDVNLADVAYTLKVGRQGFNYRRILVCKDVEDAVKTLQTPPLQRMFTAALEPANRPITFMFSGQGSQYLNMGKELYEAESIFRDVVDHCCAVLKPLLNLDLRTIIYPLEARHGASLQQTQLTQPTLFVIEYALAQLWISWGISPSSMIGHSIGEYVAACLAGVLSLEDALRLVALRGRLMQQLPKGSMLSIPLPASEVILLLNQDLALAAINAPSLCAVSGTDEAIAILAETLNSRGIECRHLQTSHAFHSQMMDDILQPFVEEVKKVKLNPPQIPYLSNVTGTWITAKNATDPDYYAQHLRQTVCFSTGIIQLLEKEEHIFLEIGPGRTLSTLVKHHLQGRIEPIVLSSLPHPQEDTSDLQFLLQSLGRLWLAGVEINWASFYQQEQRCRIPLPTYPFERQRYWLTPEKSTQIESKSGKNSNLSDWFYVPSWKRVPLVSGDPISSSCTLIFLDESGLGVQLAEYFQGLGQDVITVKIGEQFSQFNQQFYLINPADANDYKKLLQQLTEQNKIPNQIIHLWSISQLGDDFALDGETLQNLGFYSLIYLAQAITQQQIKDQIQLFVISNHLYKISGTEEFYPEKATILGACKVIPQEYSNINCRLIEVDNLSCIELLKIELTTESETTIVAYRNQYRWVQSFEKITLNPPKKENLRLQEKGVYLITGGMGGIGLSLAEYLAKTVQAKLILLGRSLPIENSPQMQKINQFKAEGSEIMLLTADVSHKEQMQNAIAQSLKQFGKINGVIHAAGIAGDGIIQFKTSEIAEKVFAPKINGTFILNHLLKDQDLDFFVLCSSLSSIQGGIGQVDYCAANAFLDAFADWNSSQNNRLTIAINWDTWQQVGMGVNSLIPNQIKSWYENRLKNGILPTEGMDIFSRILANPLPQVIVSTQNLSEGFEELKQFIASVLFTKKSAEFEQSSLEFSGDDIETKIANIWQEIIGTEKVSFDDNFFELGGHSLLAVQTISRLRETFGVELPLCTLLKDAPTIRELATVIAEKKANFEEVEDIEQLLAEIEGLSSSEIQEQLKTT